MEATQVPSWPEIALFPAKKISFLLENENESVRKKLFLNASKKLEKPYK